MMQPRDRRHLRAGLDLQGVHRRGRAGGGQGHAGARVRPPAGAPGRRPRDQRRRTRAARRRSTSPGSSSESSNVGAVKIGMRLGADALRPVGPALRLRQADRRRPAGRGVGHRARRSSKYSGSTMGNMPMGQGLAVTPIQMGAAYSAIANGGVLRPPHIVASVGGAQAPAPRGKRVISEQTASALRHDARGRARPGRHRDRRRDRGLRAGGKTGTAEKPDEHGGYSKTKFVASFVGFAPAKRPEAAGRGDGRRAAGRHLRRHRRRPGVQGDHELRADQPADRRLR